MKKGFSYCIKLLHVVSRLNSKLLKKATYPLPFFFIIDFYFLMPEIRNSLTNVYFDISASPFLYSDDVYKTALLCAPGRILFGTDFPLIGKERYMKAISGDCACEIDSSTNLFFDHVLTGRMKES